MVFRSRGSRRPGPGNRRNLGGVGTAAFTPIALPTTGIQLTSGSQYIHGGAGAFNQTLLTAQIRVRLDAKGPNTNGVICGPSSFGATTGFGLLAGGGNPTGDRGRVIGYSTSVSTDPNLHITHDTELGLLTTYVVQLDGARLRLFLDGREVGIGTSTAGITLGATGAIGINTRASAPGTLPWGAMTIVEVQTSTTKITRAEILSLASAPVGTEMTGAQRLWVAEDLGMDGASAGVAWVDRLAGTSLTIVGAPLLSTCAYGRVGLGTIEFFGDSITAGRMSGGAQNEGFRRRALLNISAAGYTIAAAGQFSYNAAGTALDCDLRHTAVGGEALGVANGSAARLNSLAADVTVRASIDAITYFGHGTNDLSFRTSGGATAAAAVAALQADFGTACGLVRGVRSGPIFIQNVLRVSSAQAAQYRAAIELYNSEFNGMIAALHTTHGNVHGVDVCTAVTPTQADADNPAKLFDGLHETEASKDVHGVAIAARALAVLG